MDESLLDPTTPPDSKRELQADARRWYVLFAGSFLACIQGLIWNTYGPIAETTKHPDTLDWDNDIISWMGNWGPISFLVTFPVFAVALDRHFRATALATALLVLLGASVRLISTNASRSSLAMQHLGSALNGMGGVYAMSAGTVISARWFPPHQRTIATSFFVVSNMLGVSASFLLGPELVPADGTIKDLRKYLWVQFVLAAIAAGGVIIYFPSRPSSAPSKSAGCNRYNVRQGLKHLAVNRSFLLLGFGYAVSTGFWAAWGPIFELVVDRLQVSDDPQDVASWIAFWSSIAGNASNMAVSTASDLLRGRKRALLIVLNLLACAAFLITAALWCRNDWLAAAGLPVVYVLFVLAGLTINGGISLFLELACDLAYPVPEGLTTSVLTVSNNLFCLVFLLLPSVGLQIGSWIMWSSAVACGIAVPCVIFSSGPLARSAADGVL